MSTPIVNKIKLPTLKVKVKVPPLNLPKRDEPIGYITKNKEEPVRNFKR